MKSLSHSFITHKHITLNLHFHDFAALPKSLYYTCTCNKYDKLFHNDEKKNFHLREKNIKELGKTCHFLTVN